jgi:hypothetical protein
MKDIQLYILPLPVPICIDSLLISHLAIFGSINKQLHTQVHVQTDDDEVQARLGCGRDRTSAKRGIVATRFSQVWFFPSEFTRNNTTLITSSKCRGLQVYRLLLQGFLKGLLRMTRTVHCFHQAFLRDQTSSPRLETTMTTCTNFEPMDN